MCVCVLIPFFCVHTEAKPNIFNSRSSSKNNKNIINQHKAAKAVSFIPTIMFSHKPKTITFIFPFRFDYIFFCLHKRINIRTDTHTYSHHRDKPPILPHPEYYHRCRFALCCKVALYTDTGVGGGIACSNTAQTTCIKSRHRR